MQVRACSLTPERLARLRAADAIVRRLSHESGYDHEVWQFPVILIPLGTADAPDSVVLRPVDSVDGMTAQSVPMDAGAAASRCARSYCRWTGSPACSTTSRTSRRARSSGSSEVRLLRRRQLEFGAHFAIQALGRSRSISDTDA